MGGGCFPGCLQILSRRREEGGRDSWLEAGFGGERVVGTTELARLRGAAVSNATREKGNQLKVAVGRRRNPQTSESIGRKLTGKEQCKKVVRCGIEEVGYLFPN